MKKNERNNEEKAQQTHHTEIERSGSGSAAQHSTSTTTEAKSQTIPYDQYDFVSRSIHTDI